MLELAYVMRELTYVETQVFHAQNAGAAACVFVDWDPLGKFTVVPRVESAPIYPGGPALVVKVPCFQCLNARAGTLQVYIHVGVGVGVGG